ncbi:hypothetical protein V8C44DRAFT_328995 [Trichoderma aethiopicum]
MESPRQREIREGSLWPTARAKSRHYQRGPCSVIDCSKCICICFAIDIMPRVALVGRHRARVLRFATDTIDAAKSPELVVVAHCAIATCFPMPVHVSCDLPTILMYIRTADACGATSHRVLGRIRSVIRIYRGMSSTTKHPSRFFFFCSRIGKERVPRPSIIAKAVPHLPHCRPHPGPCFPVQPDVPSSRTQKIVAAGARRGLSFWETCPDGHGPKTAVS